MYQNYIDVVKSEILKEKNEWCFKSDKDYREILEHCTKNHGIQYYNEINRHFNLLFNNNKNLLKKICEENDKYGKTIKENINDFFCSPSNFRYILHSFLILSHMKKINISNINVIEIGGGYGGLSLFIHRLSHLFKIKITSYTIFDLEYISILQKKYLKSLDINISTYTIDNFYNLKDNSYLISNYAFSEINHTLQKEYIDKIIEPYTKFGFITWNFSEVYNVKKGSSLEKIKEFPQTGNGTNYYVYYS